MAKLIVHCSQINLNYLLVESDNDDDDDDGDDDDDDEKEEKEKNCAKVTKLRIIRKEKMCERRAKK